MKVRIAALLLVVAVAGYVATVATVGSAIDPLRLSVLLAAGFLASTGSSATNCYFDRDIDRKSTRLNSSHIQKSRMPSSA